MIQFIHMPLWLIIALIFFLVDAIVFVLFKNLRRLSKLMYVFIAASQAGLTFIYLQDGYLIIKIWITLIVCFVTFCFIKADTHKGLNDCMMYDDYNEGEEVKENWQDYIC